jgi:hypothetical protein
MTGKAGGSPSDIDVPPDLVQQLNDLGFALVEAGHVFTFARSAIGSDVHLTLEPLGQDLWRVGVKWRPPAEPGHRMPNPLIPMSLSRLGQSVDGVTIDSATTQLLDDLTRVVGESVLPIVDAAPS